MSTRTTARYTVRGLELAFHTWGAPAQPALVCLHGFQDHGGSWARTARLLSGRYFVIAPDLRGHGESGWVGAGGDYHFYDYFYDVAELLDHLRLPRFVLVGHSMGGNVASGVTSMLGERVQALVLLEGMGFQAHDLADTVNRLNRWAMTLRRDGINLDPAGRRRARQVMADLAEAADRLRRYNERLSEAHALELAATFTEEVEGGVAWRFDPLHKVPSAKPYLIDEVAAMWRAISCPTLSLYGSESPWIPDDLDRRLACIRELRSVLVDGAGHNVHHDQPEVLARVIERFVADPRAELPAGVREGRPERR